jgi:hypothetical protein
MPLTLSNGGGLGGLTLTKTTNILGSLKLTQSPTIVTDGLTLRLDAGDSSSYPGSGTTWTDIAGTQQNITLVNSPTYTSGTPSYFIFNGSDQRGTGSGAVLSSTSYTKSVWFYLNGYTDNNLVSSDTGGHYMYFGNVSNRKKLYAGNSNWTVPDYLSHLQSVTEFSLNTWYNATITFNTTDGMKLYVNGILETTYTSVKTAFTGDGSVNIASFGVGNLLNGRISKVYCYNRSLTDDEVLQNFNVDKTEFGL